MLIMIIVLCGLCSEGMSVITQGQFGGDDMQIKAVEVHRPTETYGFTKTRACYFIQL